MQQERQEVLTFRFPLPFRLRRRLKQDLARDEHQPGYNLSRRGREIGHDVERKKKQRTKKREAVVTSGSPRPRPPRMPARPRLGRDLGCCGRQRRHDTVHCNHDLKRNQQKKKKAY